jgi:hypothetical protein
VWQLKVNNGANGNWVQSLGRLILFAEGNLDDATVNFNVTAVGRRVWFHCANK